MTVTFIEGGLNWMNVRVLVSGLFVGYPYLTAFKTIMNGTGASLLPFASLPSETAFLAANNLSIAANLVGIVDLKGYNSANYLLGMK